MTMPRETPMPRPENNVQSHRLSVSATLPRTRSKIPRAIGYTKVLMIVVSANCFPRMSRPTISMAKLKISTKVEIEIPVYWLTARPIPVVPPVTRSAGSRKSFTVRAYNMLPRTTNNIAIILRKTD